jgi:hypothetical protein
MNGKQGRLALLGLVLGLLAPAGARAGPYLGDWGWCWHPAPGCPGGDYCFLHYWAPDLYRVKYHCHPQSVDGYPPGLPVPPVSAVYHFPCKTYPAAPSPPYSYPEGYFGRPIIPTPDEAAKKPNPTQAREEEKEAKQSIPIKPEDVKGKKDEKKDEKKDGTQSK